MPNDNWFVYILRCSDNTLYTGVAKDLNKRLQQHNHGSEGAKYTRARRPVELVYQEAHPDKGSALRREAAIKRLRADAKRRLAASFRSEKQKDRR